MAAQYRVPLAHSPPAQGAAGDPYPRHVEAVRDGALERARAMVRYASAPVPGFLEAIEAAATFHDLGKLDPDIQAVLRKFGRGRLLWDHIDAGVAHLSQAKSWTAAWLVRAHHSPGFPSRDEHFRKNPPGLRLRGRRGRSEDWQKQEQHEKQIARTNASLSYYIEVHNAYGGELALVGARPTHGLPLRLALSCLVDADHSDTAFADSGILPPKSAEPRWTERLAALRRYVGNLPLGDTEPKRARNRRRATFFDSCLSSSVNEPLATCEAPVGIGKTTAVTAHLMRRAINENLRRIIVVAPYTSILSQTARTLRRALVLPGELPNHVVVEHHHKADFDDARDRDLAVLWNAPIVLTTSVSFFEALAANDPATLRKLHSLPGSAIFVDEAHSALPVKLWSQNWQWLRELAENWTCRFVFASGSLAKFWEDSRIVKEPFRLPELVPAEQAVVLNAAEKSRVQFRRASDRVISVDELVALVQSAPSPRLVIMNTVQNAALVAKRMKLAGLDVLHLSTALTPRDRERIYKRISARLSASELGWTLVATSCVEAGVDFSFRSAFRERFSVASLLQTAGRVNRSAEYDSSGSSAVYDFAISDTHISQHPAAKYSASIVYESFENGRIHSHAPARLVTDAMREEIDRQGGIGTDKLGRAEDARDYPEVKRLGRVIDADTRLVVVSKRLKRRLLERKPVNSRILLRHSVQIWSNKVREFGLEQFPDREIYFWNYAYEPEFLGYMAGVLESHDFAANGAVI